jgi:ABC-type Fe3+-siderophore transport system permease subunit
VGGVAAAILLALVDGAARLIVAPAEAPGGVVTGGIGCAFFPWLTARRRGG